MTSIDPSPAQRVGEVARLFLRLGFTAFGGPAAHIGLMRDEVVKRRQWLSNQHFLDLLGAVNLIPGPNSTEMAIHVGYIRAGWPGLIVGGACFILPAMLIVIGFAWAYVQFNTLPQLNWLLYGIKPVVMGIIAQALWALGKKAVTSPLTAIVGLAVLILYFARFNEIALLFGGGLIVMLWRNLGRLRAKGIRSVPLLLAGLGLPAVATGVPFSLSMLFLSFLKIGAVLYGTGYVLLAFMQAEFVDRLGWLTSQQLLDAIAVGQVTPGPLFTSATFVGYMLGGLPGAVLATLGIFLPSFVFVAISNPLIPRVRNSPWASSLLDGVNVTSLGLMAGVTLQLGRASLIDPFTIALAVLTIVILFRFKINTTWLIAGGAVAGLLVSALR